jgi:phage terminase small subunit
VLEQGGLLDVVDEISLRMVCSIVDLWWRSHDELAENPTFQVAQSGWKQTSAAFGAMLSADKAFRQWSDRFGLDPAARAALIGAGVKSPGVDDDDVEAVPQQLRAV